MRRPRLRTTSLRCSRCIASDPITKETFEALDETIQAIGENLGLDTIDNGISCACSEGSGNPDDPCLMVSRCEIPVGKRIFINISALYGETFGLCSDICVIANETISGVIEDPVKGRMETIVDGEEKTAGTQPQSVMPVSNRILEKNNQIIKQRFEEGRFVREDFSETPPKAKEPVTKPYAQNPWS